MTFTQSQERAGWTSLLNDEFDPYMTHRRVSAIRYEHVRPFHPGRLWNLLQHGIGKGAFGKLVRSAGFCSFATRPGVTAGWDHVGGVIEFPYYGSPTEHDAEILALGQDITFIGIDVDRGALTEVLNAATLTDTEFTAGTESWTRMPDPFPEWESATDPWSSPVKSMPPYGVTEISTKPSCSACSRTVRCVCPLVCPDSRSPHPREPRKSNRSRMLASRGRVGSRSLMD